MNLTFIYVVPPASYLGRPRFKFQTSVVILIQVFQSFSEPRNKYRHRNSNYVRMLPSVLQIHYALIMLSFYI